MTNLVFLRAKLANGAYATHMNHIPISKGNVIGPPHDLESLLRDEKASPMRFSLRRMLSQLLGSQPRLIGGN